jgi:hypothetical protein
MVEVFKTNVTDLHLATAIIEMIHKTFTGYKANFDLEDCDKILRIQSDGEIIEHSLLIGLLKDYGFCAEVLSDDITWMSLSSQ